MIRILIAQSENSARAYQDMSTKLQTVESWVRSKTVQEGPQPTTDSLPSTKQHTARRRQSGSQIELETAASKAPNMPINRPIGVLGETGLSSRPIDEDRSLNLQDKGLSQPAPATSPASAMLLQVIPLSRRRNVGNARDRRVTSLVAGTSPVKEEHAPNPTNVVRMMLDKYTISGSTPFDDFLDSRENQMYSLLHISWELD